MLRRFRRSLVASALLVPFAALAESPLPNLPVIRQPTIQYAPGICVALTKFDAIAASVTLNFFDRTFRGLPWPQLVEQYRHKVRCSDGSATIAAVANELFARLRASHTGVYTADDLTYWALQSIFSASLDDYAVAFVGILPQREGTKWFARYVLKGSPADDAGVRAGDELLAIGGNAYRPLGIHRAVSATLVVSDDGKTRRSVRVEPVKQSMQRFFLDATRDSKSVVQVSNRSVGYFHLWAGTNPVFLASLQDALSDFEKQRIAALILDLRGGYGGAGQAYLQMLQRDEFLSQLYKVVLIDDGTRSGKELLAATIKRDHMATLVGSHSAGAFLGGSPVRLFNDEFLVEVAISHFVPPDIGEIEGVGVKPDVVVLPCLRYCKGEDPQLRAALDLTQRHFKPKDLALSRRRTVS